LRIVLWFWHFQVRDQGNTERSEVSPGGCARVSSSQWQLADIDMDRRQLAVRHFKGRKDRYIIFAESTIPLLLNYVSSSRPKNYLFEGAKVWNLKRE
jgi:hypothetical protein